VRGSNIGQNLNFFYNPTNFMPFIKKKHFRSETKAYEFLIFFVYAQALIEYNECGKYGAKLDQVIFAFRDVWFQMKKVTDATGMNFFKVKYVISSLRS